MGKKLVELVTIGMLGLAIGNASGANVSGYNRMPNTPTYESVSQPEGVEAREKQEEQLFLSAIDAVSDPEKLKGFYDPDSSKYFKCLSTGAIKSYALFVYQTDAQGNPTILERLSVMDGDIQVEILYKQPMAPALENGDLNKNGDATGLINWRNFDDVDAINPIREDEYRSLLERISDCTARVMRLN